ncbi:MAG: FHA domain-containing protein [Candidatus Poribacteria bacterium]
MCTETNPEEQTQVVQINLFLFDKKRERFIRVYDCLTFGRSEGQELFQTDPLVSRKHLQFYVVNFEIFIEDLKSTNGTCINSVKIAPFTKKKLKLNDVITFGNQTFVLVNQQEKTKLEISMKSPLKQAAKGNRSE